MKKNVVKLKPGVLADTSGDLAFEIMYALKFYQFQRKPPTPKLKATPGSEKCDTSSSISVEKLRSS